MKANIGLVGWGEIARLHASQLKRVGAIVKGVVTRRPHLTLPYPIYDSLGKMLPHVDAITIAVPNHLHAPLCIQAVNAKKPVMVEKPICINSSDLSKLESLLPNAKVPVHLGYRLRWNPGIIQLRDQIGGLQKIKCTYRLGIEQLAMDKPWTRQFATSGGSFFTLGVHMLDLARWLADARGKALSDIATTADCIDSSAEYPLRVSLSGKLPSGIEIIAGTDLRGDQDSHVDIQIETKQGPFPRHEIPSPLPEDEEIEYAALFKNFIEAVKTRHYDGDEIEEVLQTHRELLEARRLTAKTPLH